MIERLPSISRPVRGRPMTFAFTRPLSPSDVSGITGLLGDRPVAVEPTPAPRGVVARILGALRGR